MYQTILLVKPFTTQQWWVHAHWSQRANLTTSMHALCAKPCSTDFACLADATCLLLPSMTHLIFVVVLGMQAIFVQVSSSGCSNILIAAHFALQFFDAKILSKDGTDWSFSPDIYTICAREKSSAGH